MANKRDLDEMNGGISIGELDPKRPRVEAAPSRVLHIRSLPEDVTEAEVVNLVAPFGQVKAVMLMSQKSQGFIEMTQVDQSTAVVNYYQNSGPASIRGRNVFLQYSNRQEVVVKERVASPPGRVLLVSIQNVLHPITLDTCHQVFQTYGPIEKIVMVPKPDVLQCLVQYPQTTMAISAKMALDGQSIYTGCCTLKIQFSNLPELVVKSNSEKARDYTNPTLVAAPSSSGLLGQPNPGLPSQYGGVQAGFSGFGFGGGAAASAGSPVVLVSNLDEERSSPDILFMLFGVCGDVIRVKILYRQRVNALIQLADAQQAQNCITYLNGCPLFSQTLSVSPSKHMQVSMPHEPDEFTKDYTGSPLHRFSNQTGAQSKNLRHVCAPTDTLHLANLAATMDEDKIVSTFARYGTVAAFRYFHNSDNMALIKMATIEEAVIALIALHNAVMDGRSLKVSFSKTGNFQ